MKNKKNFILFIFFIAFILLNFFILFSFLSCEKETKNKNLIYTSMHPIKFIIDNIKDDEIEVKTIMKMGSDPHTYEISPKDISLLLSSYAYFKVGLPFEENIVDKIKKQNKDFNIIEVYKIEDEEDPHIWLSPDILKIISENILTNLIRLYPEKKDAFEKNYKIFINKLNEIDNAVKFNIEKSNIKSFLIVHPALTYFARYYGLNQISIEEEGKIPTGKELIELSEKIKEENITFIFMQPEFPATQIAQFIKDNKLNEVNINFLDYNIFNTLVSASEAFIKY